MKKGIYFAAVEKHAEKYIASLKVIYTGTNAANINAACRYNVLHLCESKKQAESLISAWNDQFKKNGTLYTF
jgi:hypothetical protein